MQSRYIKRFPVLLTLPSHHVAAMFFIPFGKWGGGGCGFFPWRLGETPQKIKGETPQLHNFKSFWKLRAYIHYRVLKAICSVTPSPYHEGQMCTWTRNSCTLTSTSSSSCSHSISSNTKLQERSFYGLSSFKWPHSSLQLPLTASGCCWK
jgi:hypothetical protein